MVLVGSIDYTTETVHRPCGPWAPGVFHSTMHSNMTKFGRISLGLVLSSLMVWLVFRGLDWDQVGHSLRDVSPPVVMGAVILFMMAGFLRAVRWRCLFINFPISSSRLFIIQNEGIGLNNMLPVRVASDPAQVAILTVRDGVQPSTAIATLGMERIIDTISSAMILLAAVFFVPQMRQFSDYLWVPAAVIILAIVGVKTISWAGQNFELIRKVPFLSSLSWAVSELEKHPDRLIASLLLSILFWLTVGVASWFVAVGVGLPISPITAMVTIMGTIFIATTMPSAPSALGTFEYAMLIILERFGVEREAGLGFALICHAVFFLPPTIIAAIFLPREGLQIAQRLRGRLPWKRMPDSPEPMLTGDSA